MKKIFPFIFALAGFGILCAWTQSDNIKTNTNPETTTVKNTDNTKKAADELKWYTWDEAVEAQKTEKRKIFVDIYTDWCGWCKVMDKKTFPDPEVKAYIEKNFYPVKLDAEQKEDIVWNDNTFNWRPTGRNGIHMLAYSLLDGKTSYPTIVYLTEDFERIMISPGYKTPEQFLPELKFAAEEHYQNTTWEEFRAKN